MAGVVLSFDPKPIQVTNFHSFFLFFLKRPISSTLSLFCLINTLGRLEWSWRPYKLQVIIIYFVVLLKLRFYLL